jgi:hypothetical protein
LVLANGLGEHLRTSYLPRRMSTHYPPGHFGPNHAGVAEVFDFALSDTCFGPQPPPGRLPTGVLIVRALPDLDEDADIEIEANPAGPFTWSDLIELRRAEWVAPCRPTIPAQERRDVVFKRMEEVFGVMETHLRSKLAHWRRRWRRHFLDQLVVALLTDVALTRAFVDGPVPFWESVYAALRAGAIPVGWSGRFPAGRMRVFLPHDPSIGAAE